MYAIMFNFDHFKRLAGSKLSFLIAAQLQENVLDYQFSQIRIMDVMKIPVRETMCLINNTSLVITSPTHQM